MKPRLFFCMLFLLLICSLATPAFAWGAKGHRVIGALAQQRLMPAASAAIANILEGEDLATAATWADDMRASQDKPEFWADYAANWHYVNIAPGANYASSAKNPRGDAYVALETFAAILLDEPVPAGPVQEGLKSYFGDLAANNTDVKRFALKFLVHILGDLQQPLHSGYAADRGGNAVEVFWFTQRSNLHAVWDSQLLEQQDLDYPELARRLSARISRTPASDIRFIETAAPLEWIGEAHKLLERIYQRHGASTQLGADYATEFVPTVEAQLVKGGLRSAYMLNSLFGGSPLGLWRNSPTAGGGWPG